MSHYRRTNNKVTAVNVSTMDPILLLTILTQALIEMTSSSQGILDFLLRRELKESQSLSVCPFGDMLSRRLNSSYFSPRSASGRFKVSYLTS